MHRFKFTCLKICILIIYSISLYTGSCHSQHDSFGHIGNFELIVLTTRREAAQGTRAVEPA